jgi:hypothetical protein
VDHALVSALQDLWQQLEAAARASGGTLTVSAGSEPPSPTHAAHQ